MFFFFRTLALSYTPNIYTPTPIPLLYNPFTIILHKRRSAYLFQAEHTPACCIGTKQNKDFHVVTFSLLYTGSAVINPPKLSPWG